MVGFAHLRLANRGADCVGSATELSVCLRDDSFVHEGSRRESKSGRSTLVSALVALTLAGCVSVQTVNNPVLPGGDWHLYSDISVGLALALPRAWHAFDLRTLDTLAVGACASDNPTIRAMHASRVAMLKDRGVVFYACDASDDMSAQSAFAYAVHGPAPNVPLDKYLADMRQAPGRSVTDVHVEKTASGELAIQKINGTVVGADGVSRETRQWQYLAIRFGQLHVLFIEFGASNLEQYVDTIDKIGRSFTPLR